MVLIQKHIKKVVRMPFKNKQIERLVYIVKNIPDWENNPTLVEEVKRLRKPSQEGIHKSKTRIRNRAMARYRLYENGSYVTTQSINMLSEYTGLSEISLYQMLDVERVNRDGVRRKIERLNN